MPSNSYDPKVHTRWLDLLLSIWRCSGQELNGQVGPIFLNGQMGNRTVFLLTQSCTGPSFQTGKKCDNKLELNDILWSYPANSLPICVTRKSVIKVNKKFTVSCVFNPALLVKGRYSATSMHQWWCASHPALHATALSDHEHRARLDPLLSKDNEHLRQEMKHRIPLEMVDSF